MSDHQCSSMDCLDTHAPSLDCIIATLFEYPSHLHIIAFILSFLFPSNPCYPGYSLKSLI